MKPRPLRTALQAFLRGRPPHPNPRRKDPRARALAGLTLTVQHGDSMQYLELEVPDRETGESRVVVFIGTPAELVATLLDWGRPHAAAVVGRAPPTQRGGYLSTFYLAPSLRGGPLAQVVWERMREALHARGIEVLWTHFHPDADADPRVLRFWMAHLGFRRVPGVEDPYVDGAPMPLLQCDRP